MAIIYYSNHLDTQGLVHSPSLLILRKKTRIISIFRASSSLQRLGQLHISGIYVIMQYNKHVQNNLDKTPPFWNGLFVCLF